MELKPLLANRLVFLYYIITLFAPVFGLIAVFFTAIYYGILEGMEIIPENTELPEPVLESLVFDWGLVVGSLAFLLILSRYRPFKTFPLKMGPKSDFLPLLLLASAYTFTLSVVTEWLLPSSYLEFVDKMNYPQTKIGWIALAIDAVFLAPMIEEVLFRGFLLSAYTKARGPRFALYAQAAIFGLIHIEPSTALAAFGFAWIAGRYMLARGTLLPLILIHALNNVWYVMNGYFETIHGTNVTVTSDLWGALSLALMVATLWLVHRRYPLPEFRPSAPGPVWSASLVLTVALSILIMALSVSSYFFE